MNRLKTALPLVSFSVLILLCSVPCIQATAQDKTLESQGPMSTGMGDGSTSSTLMDAGQEMGSGIKRLTGSLSTFAGDWIGSEAVLGISWVTMIFCVLLLLVVMIIERVIRFILDRRVRKRLASLPHMSTAVGTLDALSKPLSLYILAYGTFWAFTPILAEFQKSEGLGVIVTVAGKTADIIGYAAIAWFAYRFASVLEMFLLSKAVKTQSDLDDLLVPLVGKTLRVFVVVIGVFIILHSLTGLELGPMLASLGIGGAALAFAGKDSIANFLGSLTIIFDKPFTVGDRIVIEGYDGYVEEVGFRSTRIRTLEGNQVTIPNEKIINTALENIQRRPHIRWHTNITVTYDTPPEKVRQAVQIIRTVLAGHGGTLPDYPPRVYFNGFNDWSLNIEVFAWFSPPDYWQYNAWLHEVCLDILESFNREGIDFAFPTQTLHLAGDAKRELAVRMLEGKGSTSGD